MSRDEGFAIADISSSLFDDPKVKKMWRNIAPNDALMNAAMTLLEATMLASWKLGQRVTIEDAAPAWMTDITSATTALKDAQLVDSDGKVARKGWNSWFGTAKKRRDQTRERWRRAKQQSEPSTNLNGEAAPVPRGVTSGSTGPSVPTVLPSVPTVSKRPPRRARSNGVKDPRSDERAEAIARAQAVVDDPDASQDRKNIARFQLDRLGP